MKMNKNIKRRMFSHYIYTVLVGFLTNPVRGIHLSQVLCCSSGVWINIVYICIGKCLLLSSVAYIEHKTLIQSEIFLNRGHTDYTRKLTHHDNLPDNRTRKRSEEWDNQPIWTVHEHFCKAENTLPPLYFHPWCSSEAIFVFGFS